MGKLSLRQRLNISRLAIKYSRLTLGFWLAVTVAGLLAFSSLKYALFPEVSFPVVLINAQAPLETIAETEAQLTKALENSLPSLKGFQEVYSVTYPGRSLVNVFFKAGVNLKAANKRVQGALKKVSLPAASKVEVLPIDLNESPVITYALTSKSQSLEELAEIARQKIIPEIGQLRDVYKINLLGDGAEIKPESARGGETFPTRASFNGQEALGLQVIKRADANTLEAVKHVEQVVQRLQGQLPDSQLTLAETQAYYIRDAVRETIRELIMAVILAGLVVFPFLRNWRAALITALAIPLSLLATCTVMALFGLRLEIITLLALALVTGVVIDDAIVDVENIARHVQEGQSPKEAAILGTDEIGLTVTASTLSIVAVFLPVAFMGGTIGTFFKPFGLTVSAAVLFSLLVARTLSPVLAVYWLKRREGERPREGGGKVVRLYRKLLQWSLFHRNLVVGLAIISFLAGIALIPLIPQGFIPKLDRGEFYISYTAPLPKLPESFKLEEDRTTSAPAPSPQGDAFNWLGQIAQSPERFLLRKTIKVGRQLEAAVLDLPDVKSAFTVAGIRGEPTRGQIFVELKKNRQLTMAQLQELARQRLPQLKGVTISVEDIPFVETGAEKPLQVVIVGGSPQQLAEAAAKLKTQVAQLSGLTDVELSQSEGKLERLDGKYAIYLSANLEQDKGLEDGAREVEEIASTILPSGIALQRWGTAAQSGDVMEGFGRTLVLSVTLMLLVLLFLFRRLLEPMAVGFSLPLSLVGSMLGLWLTGSEFGIVSLIGFIFLLGLLAKNALLLMDCANQLRREGMAREQALIETGAIRLRPIFMTTSSSILGMLPIAFGWGPGAELRQPMAIAIIGGLATASLLSLVVVPVLYTLLEDGWNRLVGKKQSS